MTALMFGLNVGTGTGPMEDPVRLAVAAEAAGFDFVSASDHPFGAFPCYETATLLTWILARTERVRVLSRVFGLPLRSPAMLAKTAESMHRLANGRLILGCGSGGSEEEFHSIGIDAATAAERLAALDEGVRVMRQLWAGERVSFNGSHVRLSGALMQPAPMQPIPLWLGTFGPKALQLTGRLGDGWIPSLGYRPVEELPAMLQAVRTAAQDAGRDPDAITYALNAELDIDGAPDKDRLTGSAKQIVEQLRAFSAAGFTAFNFVLKQTDAADAAKRVAAEVVQPLREATAA